MTRVAWRMFKVGHCRQIEHFACIAAPWRVCEFPALAALIVHPAHGPILFDTGYSARFFEATQRWPERLHRLATPVTLLEGESLVDQLTAAGISARDIRTVVLSHFHSDHISGVADFPQAALLCSRVGWDVIRSTTRFSGARRGLLPGLLPSDFASRAHFLEAHCPVPLPDELAPFEQGHDLIGDASVLAVPLPGHADGQIGITFVGENGQRVFLVADAAWSMQAIRQLAPPMGLADKLLHHTPDYPINLRRLHQLHQRAPEVLVVPSHCRERQQELVG